MKRTIALLGFCLSAAAALGHAEGDGIGTGLSVTGKAMASACIGAVYVTPSVGLAWQPGLFGVGLEVRGLVNPAQRDFYLVPFLEGRIGWFFLGLGLDLPLGSGIEASSGLIPAATLGVDIPFVTLGPGKLGLSLSADAILTLISGVSKGGSVIGDVIGTIILTILGAAKATAGLHYGVPL